MAKSVRDSYLKKRNTGISEGNPYGTLARYEDRDKEERRRAIEMLRQQSMPSTTTNDVVPNAGDNRTTALRQPNQNTIGNAIMPTYRGLNTAENGADVDPAKFKTEAITQTPAVSEVESFKNAQNRINPYLNNKELKGILDNYAKVSYAQDQTLATSGLGLKIYEPLRKFMFGNDLDKYKKEFIEKTGVSEEEFEDIAEHYKYYANTKANEALQENIDNKSLGTKLAMTPGVIFEDITGNALGLLNTMNNKTSAEDLGRDYNSGSFAFKNIADAIRESVKKDISGYYDENGNRVEGIVDEEKHPLLNKGATTLYDVPVMAGESLVSAMYPGGLGTSFYASGAYADTLRNDENRGLSEEQAAKHAAVMGSAEYLLERTPLAHLGELLNKGLGKKSLKSWILRQMREEGQEELGSNIVDVISDALISGDKSNINQTIDLYQSQEWADEYNNGVPLTKDEATTRAWKEWGLNTVNDYVMAALSAGLTVGVGAAVDTSARTRAGKHIVKNAENISDEESPYYIPDTRDSYVADEDYEQALNTREAINDAARGRVSGRQARGIYESVAETKDNLRTAQKVEATKLIESYQAKAEEKAIEQVKNASTPAEVETIKEEHINSEAVQAAVAEKKAEMIEAGKATEAEFTEAITPTKAAAMAESGETIEQEVLEELPEKVKQAYETGNADQANKLTSNVSKTDINTVEITDESGKKSYSDIKSVSQNSKGEIVFELANGESVKAAEAGHTPNGKYLYNSPNGINSLDNPVLVQTAINIERDSKHGVAIGYVTNSLKDMYTIGASGLDFEQAIKSKKYDVATLGKENLRAAYEEGKKHSNATSRATVAKKGKGLIKEATEENAADYKSQFADEATRNEYENQLSEANKSFLELFSKKIGVDIAFFNENSQDRGSYRPDEGKIYLNLYHSHNMFNVALHEGIGEFMAASNEKAYNAIVDSVLNAYAATNSTKLAKDIRAYQSAYEGDTYGGTYRGAAQELFNDALSDMFSSEENMKKLYNWMVENEGEKQANKVKKTLADYFKSVAETIKEVITEGRLSKAEERQLRISEKEANTYVDQILRAMDVAIANRDAGVVQQRSTVGRNALDLRIDQWKNVKVDDMPDVFNGAKIRVNDSISIDELYQLQEDFIHNFSKQNFQKHDYLISKNHIARIFSVTNEENFKISEIESKKDFITRIVEGDVYGQSTEDGRKDYKIPSRVYEVLWNDKELRSWNPELLEEFGRKSDSARVLQYVDRKTNNSNKRNDNSGSRSNKQSRDNGLKDTVRHSFAGITIKVDTEGRSLSEGQQKYFKDSRVVDDNGNLMVVYHGSPNEFTEFKHDFIGTTGAAEGKGFYFTNNKSMAEGYSREDRGQILKGYLNITKPLSLEEITLTKSELKKFLMAVDPTGDEILSDYDSMGGEGYPSKAWYNRALNDTINAMMQFNENDADIAAEIFNMLDKDGLLQFKNILGYDGFIARDKYPDAEVYVAFDSNQFKNADNLNPTDNPDIRYSKSVDSDGNRLSVQQKEMFKDSKAVDKKGNLLVLYHGSQSADRFNTFDMNARGIVNGRAFGDGFYFTPYSDVADFWGEKNLYKVYLNLTNPYYANKSSRVPKDVKKLIKDRYTESLSSKRDVNAAYRTEVKNAYDALEVLWRYGKINDLKTLGYDGVIFDDKDVAKYSVQYVAFYPEQIKRTDNYNPTSDSADIRKSIEVKFDEDTVDIPARDYDDMIFFTGSDEEIEAAEKQDLNVMAYFANIIQSKGFNGLMFSWESDWGKSGKHIEQRYVTKSTREGEDWHLSEGRDGEPLGHTWYVNKNDKIELYNHNNHDLSSLYSDLLQNTPKEGVKVYVLRDATESTARYSKAVFGEESQYSSQLEQTQFVSQILSTLNNQLKGTTVSMPYINDTVKYILDKYDADLNPDEFAMELAQFIAYMTANEQVDYNQMMNYLLNVGDEVIQASRLKDPEEERIYSELKKELSSHKINLTEVERKELISKYGGSWNAVFGKLNAAGIKLNNAGQHMDGSTYAEIVDKFRTIAGVQLDEETTAVDQIATILDAMDALKPSAYQWDGATDMDKALDVATTIIDRYYSMATAIKESNIVKGTEKGAAAVERAKKNEIKKLRAKQEEYKAKINEEFQQLVEDRKKVIQEQQEFYKRQAEIEKNFRGEKREFNKKANMSAKELEKTARLQAQVAYQGLKDTEAKKKNKDNIVRTCMRLINWMNKPTDTRHVPTFLKPALTDMIKSINFMPASMRKGDDGTISAIKWQESMRKLQQVLQGISNADADSLNDSDKYELSIVMEVDEIINKMQQLLDKYGGTADISRMKAEDLKTLSDIMTSISKGISQMNENFMNRRFKHVSEAAKTSMIEMNDLKPISNSMGVVKSTLADFLNLDMAEPITFFEELGSASASIMQEFFDGEKIGIQIIEEADKFFNKLGKDLGLTTKDIRAWENDAKDYTYGGVTITLTSADLMSLYCSYNREMLDQQNRPFEATHHISAGGIKGFRHRIGFKEVNRNPQVAHVTQADVVRLLDNLTETQKQYADMVVGYMSTKLAEHGNKTSNKLNGYSKFLGEYYFPLKTDNNAIATTESNNSSDQAAFRRLIFPSFTKSQIDKADNALVIMNFFDVVTEHITGMSNYCAYAMPISDAMRWYNYAETERANTEVEDEYQRYTTSVKGSLDRVRGNEARKYFENFIRDVNLDNKASGSKASKLISQGLTGLAKAKAVGLNIRVILQQPCAIIRAADVIEGKYLAEGWTKMSKNPKEATQYAQSNSYLCYWKSKGLSDTRVSQSMKEIITGQESLRQDIVEKTGFLAGLADDVTWAAMYYAAEAKIEATTDFEKGSEDYNSAVEELFSDIINHTQVIDSNLRKTGTMRSNDAIEKLANAFKKEPQKSYNMLHRAYWKVYQDPTSVEAKKGWQRAVTIFVENAFVTAIAQSLVDAWRDDDDEEGYLMKILKKMLPYDSYATVKSFVEKIMNNEVKAKDILGLIQGIYGGAGNILDNANIASSIPYVADIDSLLKGYSVTRLDSTAILTQLKNTVTTLGSTNATPYSIIYSLAQLIGYGTGIGVDNALRDLRGIYNQFISDFTGIRIEKNAATAKKNAKKKETNRISEVFDTQDLSAIKAEINSTYNNAISDGKDESQAWKAARDMLKGQYQRILEANPENKAATTNRFKMLLKQTKKSDGKGGYRSFTDKEINNMIEGWQ